MSSTRTKVGVDLGLTDDEKNELLRIARTVVEKAAHREPVPEFVPKTERLKEPRGAFICVKKNGMLRGCIGCLEQDTPVYKTVAEMAEAAAFRDPRFRPLEPDELACLELEISVLTPLEQIQDVTRIEVGLHGLMIVKGSRSGLLLPQVAAERNWDTRTFLEETCRKAGLPRDAWTDKESAIYVFSADVF
ncbi:MAG: AmmeMemoRadiSam system protein A [Thermodesulfobacteriota bacterium]